MELEQVVRILNRFSPLFRRAYVYGSVARGDADETSDIDLILVRNTAAAYFERIREVMDLVRSLGKVDISIYTEAEQRQLQAEPGRYFLKDVFSGDTRLKEPRAEALRWLRQAENDLEFARHGIDGGYYAQVCFQCQQVAEKALKSIRYGELQERVVLGHSLVELSGGLDLPSELVDNLAVLDQYYIPTRYPNGLPGSTPYEVYRQAQAEDAVTIAQRVVGMARQRLPPE